MKLYVIIENRIIRFLLVKGKNKSAKIVESSILDLATSTLSFEDYGNPEKIADLVLAHLRTLKFSHDQVYLIFNSRQVISRELQIPMLENKEEFNKMVRNEMRSNLLLTDDYIVEYALLGEKVQVNELQRVLAYAIQITVAEGYVNLFKKAKIKVQGIFTGFESFLNLEVEHPLSGMSLYFDINRTYLRMYLFDGNTYMMMRNLRFYDVQMEEKEVLQELIDENISKVEQYIFTKDRTLQLEHVIFFGNHPDVKHLYEQNHELNEKCQLLDVSYLEDPQAIEYTNAYGIIQKEEYTNDYLKQLSKYAKETKDVNKNTKFWYQQLFLFVGVILVSLVLTFGANFALTFLNDSKQAEITTLTSDQAYVKALNTTQLLLDAQNYNNTYTTLKANKDVIAKVDPTMFNLIFNYGNGITVEETMFDGNGIAVSAVALQPSQIVDYLANIENNNVFKLITYAQFEDGSGNYKFTYYVNITMPVVTTPAPSTPQGGQ